MNNSKVLVCTENRSTIHFQNIKFRKFVKLTDSFVYLEIKPMKSDEIVFSKFVYSLDYIESLTMNEEVEATLGEWIMNNVTELEKVYAVLESY